jgi:hypothetical protein
VGDIAKKKKMTIHGVLEVIPSICKEAAYYETVNGNLDLITIKTK